jgi:hypothetical protein
MAIISLSADTRKCPEPTAGSHIFKLFRIRLASFLSSILVVQFTQIGAIPSLCFIEFLHHCPADGFAAHVHGNKSGCKERTILVAVYLFEYQPQHRGIDQPFVVFLYFLAALTGKIVGIQEIKNIFYGREFTGLFFTVHCFNHRSG